MEIAVNSPGACALWLHGTRRFATAGHPAASLREAAAGGLPDTRWGTRRVAWRPGRL